MGKNISLSLVLAVVFAFTLGILIATLYYGGMSTVAQAAEPTVHYVDTVVRVPVQASCSLAPVQEVVVEEAVPQQPHTIPPIIEVEEEEETNPPVVPPVVPPEEPTEEPVDTTHANCGVGNGIDPNTPGCNNRNQDGEGTGPGNPGAKGGNGNAYGTTKEKSNNGKAKGKDQ